MSRAHITRAPRAETDRRIDALLGQGKLPGPARDRILEAALASAGSSVRYKRAWLLVAPLTAAAVCLLLLRPRSPSPELRARGGGGVVLEVGCRDGGFAACRSGSVLVFRASGASQGGYLSAWAEPEVGAGRIWYFPTDDGNAPALEQRNEAQILRQGVRLGSEQPTGRYRIHVRLSLRKLTRQQLTAAGHKTFIAEANWPMEITP